MIPHFHSGSFLKYFRYGEHLNPARDWVIIITFSAIALAGIIVWNVWAFSTVAQGGVIGSVATSSSPGFSHSSLDAINTVFENRAKEEEKYETGAYRFADPSQ
jgi:hypothetical protein